MVGVTSRDVRVVPQITTVKALSNYKQFIKQMFQSRHMTPEATGNASKENNAIYNYCFA